MFAPGSSTPVILLHRWGLEWKAKLIVWSTTPWGQIVVQKWSDALVIPHYVPGPGVWVQMAIALVWRQISAKIQVHWFATLKFAFATFKFILAIQVHIRNIIVRIRSIEVHIRSIEVHIRSIKVHIRNIHVRQISAKNQIRIRNIKVCIRNMFPSLFKFIL